MNFTGSLTTKFISLHDEPRLARLAFIDLNPNEHHYYLFIVSLERCNKNYNSLDNPFGRICVPNKTANVNLKLFNIITEINKSKTLTKHILCNCRCSFDSRKLNSNQKRDNDKCQCESKKPVKRYVCKEDYAWNPRTWCLWVW